MTARYSILARVLPDGKPQAIIGRDAWCLQQLIAAGEMGCTPIDRPAPRWSHYVWKLRTKHGLIIETIEEPHGGPFSGTHARYLLKSEVEIMPAASDAKAAA